MTSMEGSRGLPPEFVGIEVTPEDIALFTGAVEEPSDYLPVQFEIRRPEISDQEDSFTNSLRKLQDEFQIPIGSTVLNPGSSTHVGAALIFGKEHVTHVDPDEVACEVLRENGYAAETARIEDYTPEQPFDAMVALNSYGSVDEATLSKLVRPGGYIITNNYTGWAEDLSKLTGSVELAGAWLPTYLDEDAKLYRGEEVPEDATGWVQDYYRMPPGGGISRGTPEDHDFADESARYPDGLFVFRVAPPR